MPTIPAGDIRDKVREAYSAAADHPGEKHPFPVGRAFAESIGYPASLLDSLPVTCVEAFAGVSNVPLLAEISRGAAVLDLGCGAGLDSLIAARRAGPSGKVTGVDFSAAMLDRARQGAAEVGLRNVCFERADAEHIPLASASVDVALVKWHLQPQPGARIHFWRIGAGAPSRRCRLRGGTDSGGAPPGCCQAVRGRLVRLNRRREGRRCLPG